MILETEQLRAAFLLMARDASLNAEIAVTDEKAFNDAIAQAFNDAIARNMLGENGVIQLAIHGDTT